MCALAGTDRFVTTCVPAALPAGQHRPQSAAGKTHPSVVISFVCSADRPIVCSADRPIRSYLSPTLGCGSSGIITIVRVAFACLPSKWGNGNLSALVSGGLSSASGVAGPVSVPDAASSGRARTPISPHRASKVSGFVGAGAHACELGAHACESSGLRGFSGTVLATSSREAGCANGSLRHSNNDLESPGLPSYQHFCPSIRR